MRKIIFQCIAVFVYSLLLVSSNLDIRFKIFGGIVILAVVCYAVIKEIREKDKSKNRLVFKKKRNLIIFIVVFTASGSFLTLSSIANLLYPEEQMWMHSLLVPGFLGLIPTALVLTNK